MQKAHSGPATHPIQPAQGNVTVGPDLKADSAFLSGAHASRRNRPAAIRLVHTGTDRRSGL